EHRSFLADAVDVGRLAHHQAAVIDAWLHPADIITHDEEDVRLLVLSCGERARNAQCRERGEKACSYSIDHCPFLHFIRTNLRINRASRLIAEYGRKPSLGTPNKMPNRPWSSSDPDHDPSFFEVAE